MALKPLRKARSFTHSAHCITIRWIINRQTRRLDEAFREVGAGLKLHI
jgi:hypothetical protein